DGEDRKGQEVDPDDQRVHVGLRPPTGASEERPTMRAPLARSLYDMNCHRNVNRCVPSYASVRDRTAFPGSALVRRTKSARLSDGWAPAAAERSVQHRGSGPRP